MTLVQHIQPQASEIGVAKLHRATVRGRLENTFKVATAHQLGSHARGTAVRQYSDLDLMVVLRKEELMWGGRLVSSDTALQRVLQSLKERFPATEVRRDVLAALIAFGRGKQSLDVVPAVFRSFANGRPIYLIPDGEGGWMQTSPAVHDRFFNEAHLRSGNKLAKVSQLVKWWKHARSQSLPISSFYSDMVLALSGVCIGAKGYGTCMRDFFTVLAKIGVKPIQDPCGVAGDIAATKTTAQRDLLAAAVEYSLLHADAALTAAGKSDFREANRQWNLVFNGSF